MTFDIVLERRGAVAVCSCGWRSPPCLSAGLAGSSWDVHEAEAHVSPLSDADSSGQER